MTDNEKLFRQKVEKLAKVYAAKNKDYGDSFTRSLDKRGIIASIIRMEDKMNRIDSLHDKPTTEVDESLVDSLEDLANYAIMTAMWLEKQVEGEVDYYTDNTLYVCDDPLVTLRKHTDGHTEKITYLDDDDYEDDFDEHEFDYLFDDDYDNDEYDDDYDDYDHDAFLDMLLNIDSEDDESEDDPDDFSMDGEPKFRIIRRPKGGLSRKDYWDMIRELFRGEDD